MPIVRTASADAHRRNQESGRYARTIDMITLALRQNPEGLTRREIERETGLRVNQVSGRINELLRYGVAEENGRRACGVTGNVVSVVRLTIGEAKA